MRAVDDVVLSALSTERNAATASKATRTCAGFHVTEFGRFTFYWILFTEFGRFTFYRNPSHRIWEIHILLLIA
jgi:hypothetical protein